MRDYAMQNNWLQIVQLRNFCALLQMVFGMLHDYRLS